MEFIVECKCGEWVEEQSYCIKCDGWYCDNCDCSCEINEVK